MAIVNLILALSGGKELNVLQGGRRGVPGETKK